MRAIVFNGTRDISVGDRPDPAVQSPTDAVVRVVRSCDCGSDLWYYCGIRPHEPGSSGHEFIGVVDDLGAQVSTLRKGHFVVAPLIFNCGTCPPCAHGFTANCVRGGSIGNGVSDGGQGEFVRVPFAYATLVKTPAETSLTTSSRHPSHSATSWAPGITQRSAQASERETLSQPCATAPSGCVA